MRFARGAWRAAVLMLGTLLLIGTTCLQAQESTQRAGENSQTKWKLMNFAIFAGGIAYALVKYGPGFFEARSQDIQKAIKEATGLKMDADFRYSEVDKRMANLAGEVGKMRAEAKAEMDREHARVMSETADEREHIKKNTAAEIDALRIEGAQEVRNHTSELAFEVAERRLRDRFAQADSADSVGDFVNLVERGKN